MTDVRSQAILDKHEIVELIQNWGFWRDQGNWERLRNTFHPEGTITVTWFNGPFSEFIQRSMEMRKTRSHSKHVIGGSMVGLARNRATAETNVTITNRFVFKGVALDSTAWGRFYDLLEMREGAWGIVKRVAIYEKDRFDPLEPGTPLPITKAELQEFPEAYCHLGYSLVKGGFSVSPDLPTPGSEFLAQLYAEGQAWLDSGSDRNTRSA